LVESLYASTANADLLGVHLTRQTGELARVPRVLEEDHVVGIQTDCSNVLILVKKILHKKCHADVAVMRSFGKKVGNGVICFVHQIVHDEQHGLAAIEVVRVRQSLMKRYSRILAKQLLIFAVAVDDATRRRIYHGTCIFDQFKYEACFAAARRFCYECSEWVS